MAGKKKTTRKSQKSTGKGDLRAAASAEDSSDSEARKKRVNASLSLGGANGLKTQFSWEEDEKSRNRKRKIRITLALTIMVALGATAISLLYQWKNNDGQPPKTGYLGTVRDADDNAPISNATVRLLGTDCSAQVTDARGQFFADGCEAWEENVAAEIILPDRALGCDELFPLERAPARNDIIVERKRCGLDSVEGLAGVSTRFYWLTGLNVDLLASRKISAAFESDPERWIVASNPTFDYLDGVYAEYSHDVRLIDGEASTMLTLGRIRDGNAQPTQVRFGFDNPPDSLFEAVDASPHLPAAGGGDGELSIFIDVESFKRDLRLGLWNPALVSFSDASSSTVFWKFASRSDLEKMNDKYYLSLTQEELPSDFLLIWAYGEEAAGTCDGGRIGERGIQMLRFPRLLQVEVLLIENVSAAPIAVDSLGVRQNQSQALRRRHEDRSILDAAPSVDTIPFSARQLLPGEVLVYPLRISLTYSQSVESFVEQAKPIPVSERDKTYEILGPPSPDVEEFTGPSRVDIDFRAANWPTAEGAPDLSDVFVVGPSSHVETITIDGRTHRIRDKDTATTFLEGEIQGASCPFVYVRMPGRPEFEKIGPILVGYIGRDLEKFDSLAIPSFTGTLRLRELEQETSYIDMVYFIADDGRVFRPLNDFKLAWRDGRRVTLKQGQFVDVEFGDWEDGISGRIFALGYYVPNQ